MCPFQGQECRYQDLHFPIVERYAGCLLGLPNYPGLAKEDLDRVIESVRAIQPGA